MSAAEQRSPVRQAVEIAVSLGLILIIVAWCLQILSPFASLLAWGAIIAISVYPLFLKLRARLGGSNKLAVIVFSVIGLGIVIVPSWMFADSMIDSVQDFHASAEAGQFEIKPPPESVKDWPLVGGRVYEGWAAASANTRQFLDLHHEKVESLTRTVVSRGAGVFLGILLFLASILIGAALLANADKVSQGMHRMFHRLAGSNGDEMLSLTVQTIRSVTVGVLGIAMIQALAGGIGMYAVGIPAVGIWTLLILILAIAQLPPWLVLLPMIIYVFSYESTTVAVIFMIWSLIVSFADMVLKPLFLGRGVPVPMLVILLGAIGGMIMRGVMGLFVGAVILALGYKLFQWWLKDGEIPDADVHGAGTNEGQGALPQASTRAE
jgi:predicted PurR-regulated permease PerM